MYRYVFHYRPQSKVPVARGVLEADWKKELAGDKDPGYIVQFRF